VKITLQVSSKELMLEVRDNGRGISKSDLLSSTSLGLIGSRERALACGGKLVIRGIRDHGTIALLRIPIRPRGGGTA
jgi:signal transduction histidine kinase